MSVSLPSRLTFSLGANFLRAAASFVSALILARVLGPDNYGVMMFLIASFVAIYQLLDFGTSSAFFTFLSEQEKSYQFILMFFVWLAVQFCIPLFFILLLMPQEWLNIIWKQENKYLVSLALVATFFQSVSWSVITKMCEAYRFTRLAQGASALVALVHLILISFLSLFNVLSVETVLASICVLWFGFSVAVLFGLDVDREGTPKISLRSTFQMYATYCVPLLPFTVVGFLYNFGDRWLLQSFGGSIEQAFYAVAFQFGSLILLFTTSILHIFWKEIAEAHHRNDAILVKKLLRQFSRTLFFISSLGAGFLIPWAGDILTVSFGTAYSGGVATLMVMFLFPVHQAVGQIFGTFAYATSETRIYANVSIFFMIISIVVSYALLADSSATIPGLGLGSLGLALKMVLVQAIQVNVLTFIFMREDRPIFEMFIQFFVMFTCLTIGITSYVTVNWIADFEEFNILAMLGCGVLHFLLSCCIVASVPQFFGLEDIKMRYIFRRLD